MDIVVAGELDRATAPELSSLVQYALREGHRRIGVDMRQVTFCDAAGLRALTEAASDLRAEDGELSVYGPCPALELLLELLSPDTGGIEVVPAPSGRPPLAIPEQGIVATRSASHQRRP